MNREQHLRDLRARDYSAAPKVESYPEPTQAEQARALAELQASAKGKRRRRNPEAHI